MERRLAAILAADMVGYSRLMAADETDTFRRQKAHRAALIDPKIAEYGGRIVNTTGDGMLVEFPSVVDAVQCAVAIQRAMPERESEVPDAKRIRYRIGINLGEITIDDGDILGDGVNIAARLESLSEPEGLCISDVVYQNIQAKLELGFEDMGEQALKNMDRKVRAWQWAEAASGYAAEPTPVRNVLEFPDKPSIAVLPFSNISGDPDQEYFVDGIVQDIITELLREPDLFVIAPTSSFAYKGQSPDIRQFASELGVRYVLEGSVRKAGNRIRLNAQLIEAEIGHPLWAERYDRMLEDVFEVQDELTASIFSALFHKIPLADAARATSRRPQDMSAYEHAQRALLLTFDLSKDNNAEAIREVETALELDPNYGRAHASLAWALMYSLFLGRAKDPAATVARAHQAAQRAVALNRNDFWAHGALGGTELFQGLHERAIVTLEHTVELSPSNADAYAIRAVALNFVGRPEEALSDIERAIRLNPHHPGWYLIAISRALYLMGRFDEAIRHLGRLLDSGSEFVPARLILSACYMALDREAEARAEIAGLLEVKPDFTSRHAVAISPFRDRVILERYLDLLRLAGLPE